MDNYTVIDDCDRLDNEKRALFNGLSHCYSADPRTDVVGGPIFCGNRVDGFYVRDHAGSTFFNMAAEYDVINSAILHLDRQK